jgi:cellulose biosynthesis protein BcsQ
VKKVRFNDALAAAGAGVLDASMVSKTPVRLIRDVYGRITFAVESSRDAYPLEASVILGNTASGLGAFAASKPVLFRDDFHDPDAIFNREQWHDTLFELPGTENRNSNLTVKLLDRQITGQEWSSTDFKEPLGSRPPRVVFFSVKGGVGRSTALVILALHLAKSGKRVLLLDFDLESPGLSSLLLPDIAGTSLGLVDWFIETAVSPKDDLLKELISYSPLSDLVSGSIRVVSAAGRDDHSYLSKLSRVYADVSADDGRKSFAERLIGLVEALEVLEKPDIVLIDSRGGLHDLAAVSIGSLADLALLFCADSQQSWDGYKHLFHFWQQRPSVLRNVRERLKVVYGMFPEANQHERAVQFKRRSWDLFRETLYDELPAGVQQSNDAFSFDETDDSAPHSPLKIRWNPRFAEFDPLVPITDGGVSEGDLEFTYGEFLKGVEELLSIAQLLSLGDE